MSRRERLHNLARIGHHITIARRIVIPMQLQIDKPESQLPHLPVRAAISPRPDHLLKQILGDRFAGLIMARKQIQRLPLPAPVLHDLAGQFHEIPRHRRSRQTPHLHAAQHMMQQMPELMKDRLHLAMCQQSRLVSDRRCQIAAHAPGVRLEVPRRIDARDKALHPGTVALRFARIPIRIKRSQQQLIAVVHLVIAHVTDATPARPRACFT